MHVLVNVELMDNNISVMAESMPRVVFLMGMSGTPEYTSKPLLDSEIQKT